MMAEPLLTNREMEEACYWREVWVIEDEPTLE